MDSEVLVKNLTKVLAKQQDDHDDHDHDDGDDDNIVVAKFITMAVLFVVSFGFGMIPLFLSKYFNWSDPNRNPKANLVISSLLSFGGGALLCTTFMHLVPEIDEIIDVLQSEDRFPKWEFSITNLLMAIGFFIIYFVEELVHAYLRRHDKKQKLQVQDAFVRGHSPRGSLRDASSRNELEKNRPVMG